MRTIIVIPARIGSTRLPEKALADIGGEPMIVRVWRRCAQARVAAEVLVATDDERIRAAVAAGGGRAVLTGAHHASGTDRVAEAVRQEHCDLVVNVQGDEPFIEAAPLSTLIETFADPAVECATLCAPIRTNAEVADPSVVKVLVGADGFAVYFSRLPIPWRQPPGAGAPAGVPEGCRRHIGVYAFRPGFLQAFTELAPGVAERSERLEQLRILEHGRRIRVLPTDWEPLSVDTAEDLARARARAARERRG